MSDSPKAIDLKYFMFRYPALLLVYFCMNRRICDEVKIVRTNGKGICTKFSFPVSDLAITPAGARIRLGAVTPPRVAPSLRLPLQSARVTNHLRVTLIPGGTSLTPTTREFRRTVPAGHLTVHLQVTVSREPENGMVWYIQSENSVVFAVQVHTVSELRV